MIGSLRWHGEQAFLLAFTVALARLRVVRRHRWTDALSSYSHGYGPIFLHFAVIWRSRERGDTTHDLLRDSRFSLPRHWRSPTRTVDVVGVVGLLSGWTLRRQWRRLVWSCIERGWMTSPRTRFYGCLLDVTSTSRTVFEIRCTGALLGGLGRTSHTCLIEL